MPDRPYRRTVRQLADGSYQHSGNGQYVRHPAWAPDAVHYVGAFLILQKDLRHLFEYVEPAEGNRETFSYRIHELLTRTCIECEANLKAILRANGYPDSGHLTMRDYKKVEASHFLSRYRVRWPNWSGVPEERIPFAAWESDKGLDWYQTYNTIKHDRHEAFQQATLNALVNAVSGLAVLISAQFLDETFDKRPGFLALEGGGDGFETVPGDLIAIRFPDDLPDDERYDFNWSTISSTADPFRDFDYGSV